MTNSYKESISSFLNGALSWDGKKKAWRGQKSYVLYDPTGIAM